MHVDVDVNLDKRQLNICLFDQQEIFSMHRGYIVKSNELFILLI